MSIGPTSALTGTSPHSPIVLAAEKSIPNQVREEFDRLKNEILADMQTHPDHYKNPFAQRHPRLNRFMDVLPFFNTQVTVQDNSCSGNGYLNGSYIIADGQPVAIATQGPLAENMDQHFLMLLLYTQMFAEKPYNADVVVSLGSPENGRKYHPFWESKKVGNFNVSVIITINYADSNFNFTRRKITIEDQEGHSKQVTHLLFEKWPDKGIVEPEHLGKLILVMRNHGINPIVHCSAGIGRTGTFLAAYLAYTQKISVYDAVKLLRNPNTGRHPEMVQSVEQYNLACQTLDWLKSLAPSTISSSNVN